MPVVNMAKKSSKINKKDDVHQKVLEIKQRQQNWLKQRDQCQKDEIKIKPQLPSGNIITHVKKDVTSSKINDKIIPSETKEKVHIKDKFKHWIDVRKESKKNDEIIDPGDWLSVCSGAESELERLVSPELDSRLPTREQDFKNLAEKIACKVKEDLGLRQSNINSTSSFVDNVTYHHDSRSGSNALVQKKANSAEKSGLTSHSCSVCKNVMISSKHVPIMMIPCGHTLCKSCLEDKDTCPSCRCPVTSFTINIMLQQIIQEYHSPKSMSAFKFFDGDVPDTENKSHKLPLGITDSHHPVISYKIQLSSLLTRHDILSNEYDTLNSNLAVVLRKVQQQQRQLQNIKTQEDETERAICELQVRLASLRSHRNQYEAEALEIQDEKNKLDSQAASLKETISSLAREIEKVKLLSESE